MRDAAGPLHGAPYGLGDILGAELHAVAAEDRRVVNVIDHRSAHEQRPDRAHHDAVRLPLQVQRLTQTAHRELAGRVRRQRRLAVNRRGRGQVDHAGSRAVPEILECRVTTVDDTAQVDVDHTLVVRETAGLERTRNQHPGVVDQHVEPAAGARRKIRERGLPLRGFTHIQRSGQHGVRCQFTQTVRIAVIGADGPAGAREAQRDGAADTGRRAADEDSPWRPTHGAVPSGSR